MILTTGPLTKVDHESNIVLAAVFSTEDTVSCYYEFAMELQYSTYLIKIFSKKSIKLFD